MGIIGKSLQKGYERQKKSLIEQIENAGLTLIDFTEIDSENQKESSAVTSTLKSIVGGKLKPDYWQIISLEYNGRKQVYVQPYSGSTILPGEHHLYINGSIDYPIVLEDTAIFGGPVWSSSNNEYAKKLNKEEKNLKKAVTEVEFYWPIGTGKIELDWAIQVFSMGNGTSKIVMKTGRYGGMITYEVGFVELNNLINALAPILKESNGNKQVPLKNASYNDITDSILSVISTPMETNSFRQAKPSMSECGITSNSVESDSKEKKSSFTNYETIIENTVKPHVKKHVYLREIPDKQENNFRKHVMLKEFSNQTIIAAFDGTLFGSAKAGVVFTPTHCFAKEDDIHVSFELKDLVSIKSMEINKDDQVELILTRGNVLVPIGIYEEILEVFSEISNRYSKSDNVLENERVEKRDDSFYFKGKNNEESFNEAKKLQEELFSTLQNQIKKDETVETNRAAQLLVNQQFDEAIKAYLDLCEKYPHSRGVFESQVGAAYFFKDDLNTAVEYYLKSMENGYRESADYNLWEAYEILYKKSKDVSYIRKYLQLFPEGEYVKQAKKILGN